MRLIDADALERVLDMIPCADIKNIDGQAYALVRLSQMFNVIKNAPTIEPKQRWIPCSERLPNTNGIYIVTRRISDGFECRNITDACYFDGSDTWHDDTRINHERKYLTDVLAWRELPEPYRGEGEQDANANA